MERGSKKVLKELSLPLGSSPIGKRTDERIVQIYGQDRGGPQGPQTIGPLRKDMLQAEARHAKSTECDPGSPVETATPVPHCPTSRNNNQG